LAIIKGKDLTKEWADFTLHGDEQAFFALYTHYFHYLNYVGLKKNFAAAKVRDTINDVFLYFWEGRDNLAHITHFHLAGMPT